MIPQNPDALEIAYLRGGENEFVRTLVFALIHKGFLTLAKDGKSATILLAETQPNWATLSTLERNVLPWFQVTRKSKEIFDSYGLLNILKPYSAEYERKLPNQTSYCRLMSPQKSGLRLLSPVLF